MRESIRTLNSVVCEDGVEYEGLVWKKLICGEKVEIESKNNLAAFLKSLVDKQYKPSQTFNKFLLSSHLLLQTT